MATKGLHAEREIVSIRELEPEDYAAVVSIANEIYPEHPWTVEEERHEAEAWDSKRYVRRRYVATDPRSGAVIATAEYSHQPWAHDPQRFEIWIAVLPKWQRRGIGQILYEKLLLDLRELKATAMRAGVQETKSESVAWLEHRGFRELMRAWESRLDLATFDLSRFRNHWEVPPGVEIVALADELKEDPERLRLVWDLDNATAPDAPRIDPFTPASFEMFCDRLLKGPDAAPDAFFLAKAGDTYVGQSDLQKNQTLTDVLYTGFTAVRREYRGQGIAFALKLRAIDYAKRHGYREIRTWNSTLNAPMLGINVRLGFVKQPVWITFGKDLG